MNRSGDMTWRRFYDVTFGKMVGPAYPMRLPQKMWIAFVLVTNGSGNTKNFPGPFIFWTDWKFDTFNRLFYWLNFNVCMEVVVDYFCLQLVLKGHFIPPVFSESGWKSQNFHRSHLTFFVTNKQATNLQYTFKRRIKSN